MSAGMYEHEPLNGNAFYVSSVSLDSHQAVEEISERYPDAFQIESMGRNTGRAYLSQESEEVFIFRVTPRMEQ